MKNKSTAFFVMLSMSTMFGFSTGDEIELFGFLNARSSAVFSKTSNNILTTLAKGTKGEVVDVKNFSNENAGIKMKVTSGPKAGETYWIYYKSAERAIRLTEKTTEKEIIPFDIQDTVEVKTEILKDTPAIREPAEQMTIAAVENTILIPAEVETTVAVKAADCLPTIAEETPEETPDAPPVVNPDPAGENQNMTPQEPPIILTGPGKVEDPILPDPVKTDDPVVLVGPAKQDPIVVTEPAKKVEPDVTAPPIPVNENNYISPDRETPRIYTTRESTSCRGNDVVNKVCMTRDVNDKFIVQNDGPNKIVSGEQDYIMRGFEFEFPDRARSDMRLIVSDSVDEKTSHVTYSIMLFFPRSVLPSAKKVGNVLEVTLPNKEVIQYNATTKEIIGGVLSEGKMVKGSNGKASAANITYTGNNVFVRADKSGDLPYGDIELRGGTRAPSITTATISKKGFKDCKVPSKDIWANNATNGDVQIKSELAGDADFSNFLQKRCGFGL